MGICLSYYSNRIAWLLCLPTKYTRRETAFTLLKAAYVDARYNPHFVVTKEDIDALIPKVELLRDITKQICEGKIKEYGKTS